MRTSRTFDGILVNTTVEDAPISKKVVEALRNAEFDGDSTTPADYLELDIPGPTINDPDTKTIEVRDPVLPKSDHIPGQYSLDGWYEELANKPPQ